MNPNAKSFSFNPTAGSFVPGGAPAATTPPPPPPPTAAEGKQRVSICFFSSRKTIYAY